MTKEKFNKNYDVFHSFLVENTDYEGRYEMPKIKTSDKLTGPDWSSTNCW